jgi:hypothetical protein
MLCIYYLIHDFTKFGVLIHDTNTMLKYVIGAIFYQYLKEIYSTYFT